VIRQLNLQRKKTKLSYHTILLSICIFKSEDPNYAQSAYLYNNWLDRMYYITKPISIFINEIPVNLVLYFIVMLILTTIVDKKQRQLAYI